MNFELYIPANITSYLDGFNRKRYAALCDEYMKLCQPFFDELEQCADIPAAARELAQWMDGRVSGLFKKRKFCDMQYFLLTFAAPAALENLPAPDAVFIGGTKGNMAAVVEAALARNPAARVCISAIALETLSAAVAALTAHGLQAEVCQISVSRAKAAGKLHLLMANNPIFLITRADEAEKSV